MGGDKDQICKLLSLHLVVEDLYNLTSLGTMTIIMVACCMRCRSVIQAYVFLRTPVLHLLKSGLTPHWMPGLRQWISTTGMSLIECQWMHMRYLSIIIVLPNRLLMLGMRIQGLCQELAHSYLMGYIEFNPLFPSEFDTCFFFFFFLFFLWTVKDDWLLSYAW